MHSDRAAAGSGGDEREVKLAVAAGYALPALSPLAGASIDDRGDEQLRAVYWDSPALGLARAGVGIRWRSGVWTFKGLSHRDGDALVREEVEIAGDERVMPASLRGRVSEWADVAGIRPIAELDTLRRTIDVSGGGATVELVHDRVRVIDGGREVTRFEEVEVEFELPSSELADRLVRLLIESGATVDTTPKYVRALRALGWDPPEVTG